MDPGRYGVMNGTGETVMSRLGLYPDLPGAASLADRYEAVNPVLLRIAATLEIDLGLLDSLWWRVQPQDLEATALPRAGARRTPGSSPPRS